MTEHGPLLLVPLVPVATVLGLWLFAVVKLRERFLSQWRSVEFIVLSFAVLVLSYYCFFTVQPVFTIFLAFVREAADPSQNARILAEGISQILNCGVMGIVLGGGTLLVWRVLLRRKSAGPTTS